MVVSFIRNGMPPTVLSEKFVVGDLVRAAKFHESAAHITFFFKDMLHARVVGTRVGAQIRYAFFLTNSFTFTQKYPAQALSSVIGTDGHTVQDSARLLGTPLSFDGVVGGFSAEINADVTSDATGFVFERITSASFNVGDNMFPLRIIGSPLHEALLALECTALVNQIVTSINLGQLSRKQSKHGRTPISDIHTGFEGAFLPPKGLHCM